MKADQDTDRRLREDEQLENHRHDNPAGKIDHVKCQVV